MHFLAGTDATAGDDLFGQPAANATGDQVPGAHAGKEVEQHLGQAELGTLLGDDDVARQRRFHAAAQRLAGNK